MKVLQVLAAGTLISIIACSSAMAGAKQLGAVYYDWDKDGKKDKAVLLQNDSDADLYISTSQGKQFVAKAIVTSEPDIGDPAHLEISKTGGIIVEFSHMGIGRGKREGKVTIAYRNDNFVISGFTDNEWDSLDPNAATSCDVNFLSGLADVGTVRGKQRIKHNIGPVNLNKWQMFETTEKICPSN